MPRLGARLVYRTVDAMWRAAGDTAGPISLLHQARPPAGVYSSTLMRWFTDTSENEDATAQFLGARIENVMQFEKFKPKQAGVSTACRRCRTSSPLFPALKQVSRSAQRERRAL